MLLRGFRDFPDFLDFPDLYTNILLFRKKLQRLKTAFAPDARVFHPAERRAQVAQQPAVYPDDARFQLFGYAMRALKVFGPDAWPKGRIGRCWHTRALLLPCRTA